MGKRRNAGASMDGAITSSWRLGLLRIYGMGAIQNRCLIVGSAIERRPPRPGRTRYQCCSIARPGPAGPATFDQDGDFSGGRAHRSFECLDSGRGSDSWGRGLGVESIGAW